MKKSLGIIFIVLLLVVLLEEPTSRGPKNPFDSRGEPNFELITQENSHGEKNFFLKGPHGERKLEITDGAISISKALLAFVPSSGGSIQVEHLQTGETVQQLYLPANEGMSEMRWSPTGKRVAFVLTNQEKYANLTKVYVANIEENSYNVFDLKVPFHCAETCKPKSPIWSKNGELLLGLTFTGDMANAQYQFAIMNSTGKILHTLDIPNEEGLKEPYEYKWTDDESAIEYRYGQEKNWKKITI